MPKYKPPAEERDARLLARELLLRGLSQGDVVQQTNLKPDTVDRISKWLESETGKLWVREHHPELAERQAARQAKGEEGGEPVDVPYEEGTDLVPGSEVASHTTPERGAAVVTPPPRSYPSGQTPTRQREDASTQGTQGRGFRVVARAPDAPQPQAEDEPEDGRGKLTITEQGIEVQGGPMKGNRTQAFLTPAIITFYDYSVGRGYDQGISQFLEDCVTGYFRDSKGLKLAIIRELA